MEDMLLCRCFPCAELADICHAHNVPLLVDEAHGGHLDLLTADCQQQAAAAATAAAAVAAAASDPLADSSPAGQSSAVPSLLKANLAAEPDSRSRSSESSCTVSWFTGSPESLLGALSCGADLVMHSSHKVLTAMTQSAMLHLKGTRVDHHRISKALQVSL
jgi:arginine/lysine/ornithine decarboxylase